MYKKTKKIIGFFILFYTSSLIAAVKSPFDFDYRTKGFNIHMDSRIAVDGKRICFKYARKNSTTRCEAIKNCQPDALKAISNKLESAQNDKEKYDLLIERSMILAFKEATLVESESSFSEAYNVALKIDQELALDTLAMIGVVQLRLGELRNCIQNHNSDSCLFPLSKKAQHIDKKGSESALKTFYKYLKERPNDDHVKWLVNILHMTLGTYPQDVPKNYLISLDKIKSEQDVPKMTNIAQDIGITEQGNFGGVAVADFNGDNYLDIIFGSLNQCEAIKYYQYDPVLKKYVNKSVEAGLENQLGTGLILTADYDNDGDVDFLVTRGAWHPGGRDFPTQGGFAFNSLLENQGQGKFIDVTEKRGLKTFPNSTLSANWGDLNNDGLLDLFVSNESSESEVFLNRGTHFENFTAKSGIINKAIGKGTVLADLNNDGNLDLVISNYAAPNMVFFGKGDGSFMLSKKQPLLEKPEYGFPVAIFDYNNDGYQDIFLAAFAPDIDNFAKWLQGKDHKGEAQKMYKNKGDGTFQDVTEKIGLNRVSITMSVNFGDIDNDGFNDLYLGTGANSIGDLEPNHLYKNNLGKNFLDVTSSANVGSLQKGHGIAFADLNGDGQNEIILEQGGSSHGDRYYPAVFFNPEKNSNSFLELKLEGKKANRQGLHSKVTVEVVTKNGKKRKIYSWIGSTGSFGTNPADTLIGLGEITKISSVRIDWHGSKTVQILKDLKPNQKYLITESSQKPVLLEKKTIDFKSFVQDTPEQKHQHTH